MHAKNFSFYDCSNRHIIKAVRKSFPKSNRMSSFALFVKSIDPIDTIRFMITSKNKEIERIFDFVSEKETYCFKVLFASVNVVSHEEVI
jgi:hypothetical protein